MAAATLTVSPQKALRSSKSAEGGFVKPDYIRVLGVYVHVDRTRSIIHCSRLLTFR